MASNPHREVRKLLTYGEIAQLVERGIEDPSVGGSTPSLPTIKNQFDFFKKILYNICIVNKKRNFYYGRKNI